MTRRPPPVRRIALSAAVLLLGAPAVVSCGFDYATNRINTIAMGVNDRAGVVDVLGAVVVSDQPGSGTLVTTLVNNSASDPADLREVLGEEGTENTVTPIDFEPVDIPPRGRAVLATEGGIPLEGDFVPGDFVNVTLAFASGEQAAMQIPVVPGCRQWEGLDESASALASQSGGEGTAGEQAGGSPSSEAAPAQSEATEGAWSCETTTDEGHSE